jgi:hypothetical protein
MDLLVVHKRAGGAVERLDHPALAAGAGAAVAALIGLEEPSGGADGGELAGDEELWSLDEALPEESAAAIALVEHRWASGLRDAIASAGGAPVADAWIHPADLAAAGLATG